jgi:ElaB/YqjD/DUF883 family membrane-anchored ribosome-binding protein
LAGNYGIGTLAFISPENKTVSHQKLKRINDEHQAIVKAVEDILKTRSEGGTFDDVLDFLRKNPDASLIEELDRLQKARKIKVHKRRSHRLLKGANAGTGTAKQGTGNDLDKLESRFADPLEVDWKKTEMGALVHQVVQRVEAAIAANDDAEARKHGKILKLLDYMSSEHEHLTAPLLGYDAIGRHAGVTKFINRSAMVIHERPMGLGATFGHPDGPINNEGDGVIQLVDELSPGHFEESIKAERAGKPFRGARGKKKKGQK